MVVATSGLGRGHFRSVEGHIGPGYPGCGWARPEVRIPCRKPRLRGWNGHFRSGAWPFPVWGVSTRDPGHAPRRERREAEQRERERRRGEKLRRRELRRERRRRRRRRAEEAETEVKPEAEAKPETEVKPEVEAGLRVRVRAEERKLLLAQRNLQSLRLVAALLGRAEAARLRDGRRRRAQQEAELRRVEEEQRRALGLQRRERELRRRLLGLLLARGPAPSGDAPTSPSGVSAPTSGPRDLLGPVLEVLQRVSARGPAPLGPEAPPPAAMETPTPPKPEEEVRQSRKRLARAGSGGEDDVVGDAREGRGRRGEGREQRRRSRHRRGGDHGRSRSPRKR